MRFILSADYHARPDMPRCRLDADWMATQRACLTEIREIANKLKLPLAIVGDIFHVPKVGDRVRNMFVEFLHSINAGVCLIAGNHDLPHHAWENVMDSSFGAIKLLIESPDVPKINHLNRIGVAAHFGTEQMADPHADTSIVFTHRLVFPDALPHWAQNDPDAITASDLLKQYPSAKWIFTGDYHHAFIYEENGRYVVNPGCVNRQSAKMKDYKPLVYIVDTDAGTIDPNYLKADTGKMVTDAYLRVEEEREDRITAFVDSVRKSENVSLDFLGNLKSAMSANKELEPVVRGMIEMLITEE